MDVRLPAEVRRPLQVSGPVCFVSQIGQAAPVDPLGPPRPLQRPVRRLLPRLAGLLQPVPGLGLPRLPRPPLLRGLRVVALEPLLGAALDPVMAPLGEHQVRVGVLPVRATPMDGQRIGQPLLGAHPFSELACKLPPFGLAELLGERELDLAVQAPVGALVLVCRLPVRSGVVLGPLRHVPVFFVFQFLPVLLVAPLALDVIALGAGRLPPGAGTETSFKMKYCHASMSLLLILSTPFYLSETGIVRPLFIRDFCPRTHRRSNLIHLQVRCYHYLKR